MGAGHTPVGYRNKDWYPWRYRRRLSLVSKPIVRLGIEPDASLLLAPGLIRDGVKRFVEGVHEGDFDAKDLPGPLQHWIGRSEDRRGHRLNQEVAVLLSALGWVTRSDFKPTAALNRALNRNYGDIDVLAWKGGRVLVIECKDLELARTPSEIARQLYEFRGVEKNGKRDRLRKHLDRVGLLVKHREELVRTLGLRARPRIEGLLVLSRRAPLHYATSSRRHGIRVLVLEELNQYCQVSR